MLRVDGMTIRRLLTFLGGLTLVLAVVTALWFDRRYRVDGKMEIPVKEFTNAEYPEDPANRSVDYGRYAGRKLKLIQLDETHFDFVFEPLNAHAAQIAFRNVDLSLFVPTAPEWTKADPGLEKIAFVDREWNRQQVSFKPGSAHLEITGGNGFEKARLHSAEIARNCLNAGLWEVLLFTEEGGSKALYYQGWFDFPLGHYKNIFERRNAISYWKHWWRLEHWVDPAGTIVPLEGLRTVQSETVIPTDARLDEAIFAMGEQRRKTKTVEARNLLTWKDMVEGSDTKFAAFIPPGRYSLKHLRNNEYWRLDKFQRAILRNVKSPGTEKPVREIELVFEPKGGKDLTRFIVSGIDLDAIPRLSGHDYPKGLYMPMGIGVGPFFQSYEELQAKPPFKTPYFSVMLDGEGRWLNHHDIAIDGPILHRDAENPNLLHICLLSYERHTLVGHYALDLSEKAPTPVARDLHVRKAGPT